jgi:ribosome-associated toxin RatA of RatAB toxin-antitoxin module
MRNTRYADCSVHFFISYHNKSHSAEGLAAMVFIVLTAYLVRDIDVGA